MKFTNDFVKEANTSIIDFLKSSENYQQFSIDIDGGFAKPPVLSICRAMNEGMNFDHQVELTKYCILGKNVKIYLDEKEIGNIIMTSVDAKFDVFPVFEEYPMSLQCLIDTCIAHISKKYLPSLKNTAPTMTAVTPA
jgi:hypothetical protein